MPHGCDLAKKTSISPEDLRDKPLILSHQKNQDNALCAWLNCSTKDRNIIATYNLLFNASLLVEEGLGYAIGLDGIINTGESSRLCFRPLEPRVEAEMHIVWKRYQIFSKAAEQFVRKMRELYP